MCRLHPTEVGDPERAPAGADPDTALEASGSWLDSVDVLGVILTFGHEFGAAFEAGDNLTPETLCPARRLPSLVRSKLSA